MPRITYQVKYHKNEGLVISPEELQVLYFYGISTKSKDGSEISSDTIKAHIKFAQQELEKYLEIRFNKQFVEHTNNYFKDDYWGGFPILPVKLPVAKPLSFIGYLNGIEQIKFPLDWVNVKKDSEGNYAKKLHLIPTGSTTSKANNDMILTGITAYLGLMSYGSVANYFTVQYLTGYNYEDIPLDLLNIVGKLSAISVFTILGDIPLGTPGITGLSLGMDGLSQSFTTTLSSGNHAFSARVKQYSDEVNASLGRMKKFYKSVNFIAV